MTFLARVFEMEDEEEDAGAGWGCIERSAWEVLRASCFFQVALGCRGTGRESDHYVLAPQPDGVSLQTLMF